MGRGKYSDEVRTVCIAALLAGESVAALAVKYNVPVATLRSWKARAGSEGATPLVSEDVPILTTILIIASRNTPNHTLWH